MSGMRAERLCNFVEKIRMKNNTTKVVMTGNALAGAAEATGLRFSRDGNALEAVGMPTDIAGMPLRPLCEAAGTVIASLGSSLYAVRDGGVTMIADAGAGVEIYCGISGGNRAIVMTSAGALHVVTDGEQTVCLGSLPALPQVDVELATVATLSETVQAVGLSDPDVMRGGALSARDAASLTAALDAAWQRVRSRAVALGASIVPEDMIIMAEVRQLDARDKAIGSRGRMTAGPGVSPDEMKAALNGDTIGPFVFSVPVVKAKITVGAMDAGELEKWGAGSIKAEVALGAAPPVAATWTMRVERPASGEPRLAVIPHLEAAPAAVDDPLQSVAVVPVGSWAQLFVSVPERIVNPVSAVVAGEGFTARAAAVSGDVVVWGCLDGAEGEVAVAPASSPLALMSRSAVSLSPVAALVAAPRLGSVALSPGCAHFYLFTSDGILNLSVGVRRGAPAASLLDRRGVGSREQVAVMAESVVALTDRGDELVMLRGGRSSTLFQSGAQRFRAVAPGPAGGEIYLLTEQGGIRALDTARSWLTRRPMPYVVEMMTAVGGKLYLTHSGGLADATESDPESNVDISWRSPVRFGHPLAVRGLVVAIDAPGGFEGTVGVWPQGFPSATFRPEAAAPMWQASVSGAPRSPLAFRLPMPVRAGAVVEIAGTVAPGSRIAAVEITGCRSSLSRL